MVRRVPLAVMAAHILIPHNANLQTMDSSDRRFRQGDAMSRLRSILSALRLPLCALALGLSLAGCASMQGASTDPNACVGPVDYCQPFFGS
jgi:hypothetical protein